MAVPNPFFDIDPSKVLADLKIPGVDVESLVSAQRRNIEALTQANHLAVEGVQAVARRQAEILRNGFEEASSLMRDMIASSPQDRVAKQTEAAKRAIEKSISNAREIAEMVAKVNSEAFDVINKRMTESLDEVRNLVAKKSAEG